MDSSPSCSPLVFGNDVDSVDVAARTAMVRFLNSTALGYLISLHTDLKGLGAPPVLIHVSKRVRDVLELTGVDKIFSVFDSLDEARAHFDEQGA